MNEQHGRSIRTAIQMMAGTYRQSKISIDTGEVVSVDKLKRVCIVAISNETQITCKLMAQIGDGFLLVPKIGSTVTIIYATFNDAYVISFSDLDGIGLLGEELGGLVKVIELTNKLNNLENKVNSIISSFNSHVHTGVTTGPGSSGTTVSLVVGELTPTQRSEIENQNVKHGS